MVQFKRKGIIVWLLAYFLVPGIALAQDAYVLYEGDLVQAEFRCEKDALKSHKESYKAKVLALKGNFLHVNLLESEEHRLIPWNCMEKWWIGEEKLTRGKGFGKGAAFGFLGGGALGIIIGSTQEYCIFSCSPATGIGFILGAPAGILIGGIIGATTGKKRVKYKWHRQKNNQIIVEPRINSGTVGAGIKFVF